MSKQALSRKGAYQKSFEKHGPTFRALQWNSKSAAEIRYQNIVADIEFDNKSVLDIGCGFGDIIPFIETKSSKFEYTGIDIVPEFIKESRKRYPKHSFQLGDWMELIEKHDIILCSGVLNNKVKGSQYSYRKKAISLMYKNANETLGFNMAGGFPQPENKDKYKVYYVNSLIILEYCLSFTRRVILRHHYRNNDFTILMFRE